MKFNSLPIILLLTISVVVLLVLIPAQEVFGLTGSISISPTTGIVGSQVTISGSGFTPDTSYNVKFDQTIVATSTTSATGTITNSFFAPSYPRGNWNIIVTTSTDTSNSVAFTITPKVLLNFISGHVGDELRISGQGFRASSAVTIYFDNTSIGSVNTNTSGSFSGVLVVIPQVYQDEHTVRGKDATGYSSPVTFTVLPKITLDPEVVVVGSKVTITGSGFSANSTIKFYIGSTTITLSSKTNTSGSFTNSNFLVPAKPRGTYTFKARDSNGNSATADFDITQNIKIDPESGPSGTIVKINGNGFTANKTITVSYDNAKVTTSPGTVLSGSDGGFSVSFIVPDSASGTYVIKASDGSYSANVNFTIQARASISPAKGNVGTNIDLAGSGFVSGRVVTVRYDDIQLFQTSADAKGFFSAVVKAPPSPGGNHTIVITDGKNSLSYTFTILANVSLNEPSGHVGSDILISGTGFASNKKIDISYDTSIVTTAATDTNGNLSVTFKAPVSEGGSHTITVTDGATTLTIIFMMESDPPQQPVLISPANGSKAYAKTEFQWAESNDPSGVTYTFQVAKDAAFSNIIMEKKALTTTGYSIPEENKLESVSKREPYYWRVKAIDGAFNESPWAMPQSFYLGFVLPSWGLYIIFGVVSILFGLLGFWMGRITSRS